MRILNKLFTKNKLKNNIECVFKHLIACSAIKSLFFSQEILGEERIPPGSHEENNALKITPPAWFFLITWCFLTVECSNMKLLDFS